MDILTELKSNKCKGIKLKMRRPFPACTTRTNQNRLVSSCPPIKTPTMLTVYTTMFSIGLLTKRSLGNDKRCTQSKNTSYDKIDLYRENIYLINGFLKKRNKIKSNSLFWFKPFNTGSVMIQIDHLEIYHCCCYWMELNKAVGVASQQWLQSLRIYTTVEHLTCYYI